MIVVYVILRTRAFVLTRLYAMILYTSVNASACRALPKHNELFQFFDGSFLEASKAVLFRATAIHCHHGMDFVDASFFILGPELLVCPQFQVTVSHRRSKNARAS